MLLMTNIPFLNENMVNYANYLLNIANTPN